MKHILLLAVMFALVFGSSAGTTETRAVGDSGVSAYPVDVEGVTIYSQQKALLKPGYSFKRESKSSLAVMKNLRDASFQTGTLTCTSPGKRICTVDFNRDRAGCSNNCYFVGVRGGIKAR